MKRILFYLILILFLNQNLRLNAQCMDNTCDCVYSVALQEDTLWIGTKVGLFKYNIQTGNTLLFDKGNSQLPHNYIYTIKVGQDNSLWIGTYGGGLANLKNNNWSIFDTNNSPILTNNILGIECFNEKLWIATDKGVVTYDFNEQWDFYNETNSLMPSTIVYSLVAEGDSVMWFAVHGGLFKYNGNWTKYNRQNSGLPHTTVYSVATKGHIKYIGTAEGLVRFDGTNWKRKSSEKTLIIKFNVNNDESWTGTSSGLYHFHDDIYGPYNIYHINNSIMTNNYIQALVLENDENIWFGTWGGGVYKLTSGNLSKIEFCTTTGIADVINNNFSIYPNPAISQIRIENIGIVHKLSKVDYFIYNTTGQILMQGTLEDDITINIESLASGMYFLKVFDKTVKFVKLD